MPSVTLYRFYSFPIFAEMTTVQPLNEISARTITSESKFGLEAGCRHGSRNGKCNGLIWISPKRRMGCP